MSKNVIGARMIHRLSSVSVVIPTVPNPDNNDHTMGWGPTDIYKGEFFMNMVDNRVWTRMNYNPFTSGITEFMMVDVATGKMPSKYMLNQVDGNFLVTENLTVGGLSLPTPSSDLRAVFADSNGMLTISSIVPGQGTVRKVMTTYGLISDPSTGITDMGTIQMGLPHSIHSGSTNGFISNTGHTHAFIPAGNTNEIQINSGGTLTSSSNFKYDGNDLYVVTMTTSGTSYMVYYNPTNGKITYNLITNGGTVTSISAGSGMSFTDITSTGYVTLGTPSDITSSSINEVSNTSHTHAFIAEGISGSIQYKMSMSSSITGNTSFKYIGSDLYISGMTSNTTTDVVYYDTNTGQLTHGLITNGGGASLPTGTTSFDTITDWVVDSYSSTTYKFMIYHYCVYSGETNSRAGTITIVNNSTTTRITESSTSDIGNTGGVTFLSAINGSNVELRVNSLTDGWICDWIKITK